MNRVNLSSAVFVVVYLSGVLFGGSSLLLLLINYVYDCLFATRSWLVGCCR